MKFKKTLISIFSLCFLGSVYFYFHASPLESALKTEILSNFFPEKPNDDLILPMGFTFGPWPMEFRGEPIVTKLTYLKGPPKKFIDSITQVWQPVEVELTLLGPKTIIPQFSLSDWRKCFQSEFFCSNQKTQFWKRVFPDASLYSRESVTPTWFESMDPKGVHGVHVRLTTKTYTLDRFAVITPNGSVQVFSLKTVLNPIGQEARELFIKTLGGLSVSDDLSTSRLWIENKIKNVNFEHLKRIQNPKERLRRMILIQNWIYSYLSVDPTSVDSFFHLAGITHRLALDLLKTKNRYFVHQESWIISFQPLLKTLITYAKDFPNSEIQVKNMQALLEDVLLEQSKMSHR